MCTHAFVYLWICRQVFCSWMFHYGCCRLKKQVAQKSPLDVQSNNNPAIQSNEELGLRGFSMFSGQADSRGQADIGGQADIRGQPDIRGQADIRGQEDSRWVCSRCWAVNNPVTENIFIRPSSVVASVTFHLKNGNM